jgi:RNA polymerase sigma-70 factor (ECF subfamily)
MTVLATHNDDELLRLMRAGDEDAFALIYERWQGRLYRFALQMGGSHATAEDVTQEVFMALMRASRHYDPARGPFSSYIYGIARHLILRRLRRERGFVRIVDAPDEGAEQLIAWGDPLTDLARDQMIARLRQAVIALPARYREVVVLCDLHEMSYTEAAAVIGCAVGTVRSRLHRARALLAEKLRSAEDSTSTAGCISTARCFG